MLSRFKRGTWAFDILLATYTLVIAAVFLMVFARCFTWAGTFAILIMPTFFLSLFRAQRSAGVAAAVALLVGAVVIVPPRWSIFMDMMGFIAVLAFAFAALAMIFAARASSSRMRAPITRALEPPLA